MTKLFSASRFEAAHRAEIRLPSVDNYTPPRAIMAEIVANIALAMICGALAICVTILNRKYNINYIQMLSSAMVMFIFGACCGFGSVMLDYVARLLYARETRNKKNSWGFAEITDYSAASMAVVSFCIFAWSAFVAYSALKEVAVFA